VEGARVFCLADDEMISMRYARNLADGHGAVWNPGGERVEGYSNPLWMLLMAGVHRVGFSAATASLAVQIAGLLFLMANLFAVRALARTAAPDLPAAGLVAAAATALYFPLNLYSALGFEVSVITLIFSISALWTVRALRAGRPPVGALVLLGAGTWVRLDVAVGAAVLLVCFFLPGKPIRWRAVAAGAAVLLAFLGVQTALRLAYYGEWLPNPYYLKMTGYPLFLRVARGALVLWDFLWRSNLALFFLAFLAPFLRRDRFLLPLVTLPAAQMFYSVWVGGDSWEFWGLGNRFVLVGMPLLFVLLGLALSHGWRALAGWRPGARRWMGWAAVPLAVLLIFNLNSPYAVASAGQWLSLKPLLDMPSNKKQFEAGRFIRSVTRPGAVVAVAWGGIVPYFTALPCVDLTGKNDPVVARGPMRTYDAHPGLFAQNNITRSRWTYFYPGHLKWDYARSIGELRPDVILQLWGDPAEAEPFLGPYRRVRLGREAIFVRGDSDQVLWDRVEVIP